MMEKLLKGKGTMFDHPTTIGDHLLDAPICTAKVLTVGEASATGARWAGGGTTLAAKGSWGYVTIADSQTMHMLRFSPHDLRVYMRAATLGRGGGDSSMAKQHTWRDFHHMILGYVCRQQHRGRIVGCLNSRTLYIDKCLCHYCTS